MRILKKINLNKCLLASLLATTSILGLSQNISNVYAIQDSKNTKKISSRVEPYYFDSNASKYKDYTDADIPPAIRLTQSVDGMPVGTILYRTQYLDMTYYSPVAPAYLQDTEHESEINKKYRLWGPWDMPLNQVGYIAPTSNSSPVHYFVNSYTYKTLTIKSGASIDVLKEDGTIINNWGSFTSNAKVSVKAVSKYYGQIAHVYFSLDGLDGSIKKSSTIKPEGNIARVALDNTSNRSKKLQIWREATGADSNLQSVYDNFTHYGNYVLDSDSHEFIEEGLWVNSSGASKYKLEGKTGEWNYLGYNANADPLLNPYYPSTVLHFRGCMDAKYYDWRDNPWASASSTGFPETTIYDTESRFNTKKAGIIKEFLKSGILKGNYNSSTDVNSYLNKFSLETTQSMSLQYYWGKEKALMQLEV